MKRSNGIVYKTVKGLLAPLFKWIFHPTVIQNAHIPGHGPAIIAGNHIHALDPVLVVVSTKRVIHTLAKKELHDSQFGWFFRMMGSIPVDLHAAKNKDAFESAEQCLNNGRLINISPEAQRNTSEELLLPFKFGAAALAKRTSSPIIPYAITGDYRFRSRNLKILFGEPLDVSNLSVEEATGLLFNSVKALIIQSKE